MKKYCLVLLLVNSVLLSWAQNNPGGVNANLKLWIQANTGTNTTTPGAQVTSWTYVNSVSAFTGVGAAAPLYNTNRLNFLPAITFSGAQLMDGPSGVNAPIAAGKDDYCMFAVWRSTTTSAFQRIWQQRNSPASGADGFALATWNDNRYGDQMEISPYDYSLQANFSAGTWNITQLNLLNQATSDLQIVTASNLSTTPIVIDTDPLHTNGPAIRSLTAGSNRMGSRDVAGEEALSGDIAEVIVFDRPINTGGERERIFSYLALKYGIPTGTSLLSSTAATIWDAVANSTYNNAVFGLGRDDGSGLLITRSNSYATGSGDGTGQSGKGNIVLSNPSALTTDGTFLLIGNDNAGFTPQVPSTKSGAQQIPQRWKAALTGTLGTIDLGFDLTGLTTTGTVGNVTNFQLQIDEDGDGDFTTGTQTYTNPTSFTGSVANFTGITLNNGVVFTLITSATALPVTWRDFTATLTPNGAVSLHWQVDNNQDARRFDVQHSTGDAHFEKIGEVANIPTQRTYHYTYTPVTTGNHYFRINEVDLDGQSIYSRIAQVNITSLPSIKLINNNSVEITSPEPATISIELLSAGGARIWTRRHSVGAGVTRLPLDVGQLAAGAYLLKIVSKSGGLLYQERTASYIIIL